MSITELLKQHFNATEEQTQSFTDAMRENKIFTASEENLDIRYGKLKNQHEGTNRQLEEALATIAELKKSTKGQEEIQQQITAHEQREAQLQLELEETKLNAAIKVELLSNKAKDVDYLTYKLREKLRADNETLSLDDNGNIKGWAPRLESLKTQFPAMFESTDGENNGGYQVYQPNTLEKGNGGELTPTKESFRTMTYEQRVALKQKNEALYKQLAK